MTSELMRLAQREIAAGRPVAALTLLEMAPTLAFDAGALQLFAMLGIQTGRHELVRRRLDALLLERPDDPALLGLAAAVAQAAGDRRSALIHAEQALKRDPAQPFAAPLVVEALSDALHLSEAIRISEACLKRDPHAWGVRLARVFAWMAAGECERALADAEHARAAAPHSLPARMNYAMASLYLDEPAAQVRARHALVAAEIPVLPNRKMVRRERFERGVRPLRVGFVSADLRRHPVGLFIEPLLRHLDPRRAQAIVFSDTQPDAHTDRLRNLVTDWHDTRPLRDEALFDLVQARKVDILVDLGGYTAGARPRLFATRSAPCQIGYLGYLHPLGLPAMDGIVGDSVTLDAASDAGFERPLRLARHLLCYSPPSYAPPVLPREPGPIRFGSFNHLAKLSPATVQLWGEVLEACPGSTLTLSALGLSDAGVRALVERRFAAVGVDRARLRLLPVELDPQRFLAQYQAIDIALDPLPFNGGTTSLQALWQGVPVLTLPGDRMASRLGGSMLRSLGLDEFVASDRAAYLRIARGFASDPSGLAPIRDGLRERMLDSGITDGRAFSEAFLDCVEQAMQHSAA